MGEIEIFLSKERLATTQVDEWSPAYLVSDFIWRIHLYKSNPVRNFILRVHNFIVSVHNFILDEQYCRKEIKSFPKLASFLFEYLSLM